MNFSHYTLRLAARKMCFDVTKSSLFLQQCLFLFLRHIPFLEKQSIFIAVVATFSFLEQIVTLFCTHTHKTTTTMPSEEQQLAEPLLDDGGNDRFVLFPLKYDAVWEMVRALVILLFLSSLLLCSKRLKFLASYSRSSLSLSLRNQMQYKKAQASFWTAGTFCFFFTIGFFQNDALLLSSRYRVKISKIYPFFLSLSLSLLLSPEIKQRKSIYKTT